MRINSESFMDSIFRRALSWNDRARAREQRAAAFLFVDGFLLMLAYYTLKPVRESMLLASGSAELRSYAVGTVAVILLLVVPLLGHLLRRFGEQALSRLLTLSLVSVLVVFVFLDTTSTVVGTAFFIWLGIFGVTMVAQYWALASCLYTRRDGRRVFPIIAIGIAIGAFAGALLSTGLFTRVGERGLMLIASFLILGSQLFGDFARSAARPVSSCNRPTGGIEKTRHAPCKIRTILKNRYLLLIALSMALLNCVNSIGEFVLAEIVVQYADQSGAAVLNNVTKSQVIGSIYGRYYLLINLFGLLMQLFIVTRVFRNVGVANAAMILPIVMITGYGIIGLFPVLSVVFLYFVIENSTNYSLHNTIRHVLFLNVDEKIKHQAKTTIDTLFWRVGDMLQVLIVFGGLYWFDFGVRNFIVFNISLVAVLAILTIFIAREYRQGSHFSHRHRISTTSL